MQPEPMQPEQLEYFRHPLIFLKNEIEQIGNTGGVKDRDVRVHDCPFTGYYKEPDGSYQLCE